MRRFLLSVVLCLGLLVVVSGCGSSDSDTTDSGASGAETGSSPEGTDFTIDLGTTSFPSPTTSPKIAYFSAGSGNVYLQNYNSGVEEEAENLGVEVETYDSLLNPETQLQQMENVLQQGGFDGWLTIPLDGNSLCPILTKQAPAAEIVVVSSLQALCGRGTNPEGEEQWAPGTVAQVQQDNTYTEDEAWLESVAERLPGEHTVAMLNAPPLFNVAQNFDKAIEQKEDDYPNLDFKFNIATDQTTPDCLAKTQNLLQAQSDVDVILSNYSDCTVGAIKAIQAAGKSDEVQLFDVGGSKQSFEAIEDGDLILTTYHTPKENGKVAVRTLVEAFSKKVPRYVGIYPKGASIGSPLVIDAKNVKDYEAEY